MVKSSGKLLSADVYEAIRSDVLAGRREPGARIKIAAVADQCGVSLSVVREALTRLAEQGLLINEPNHGFCVIPLSPTDLTDLTHVRIHIEGLAIHQAIERGDITWEASVIGAHHVLECTPLTSPQDHHRVLETWATAHTAFHHSLIQGCNSPRLIEIAQSLRDAAELYRRWSVSFAPGDPRDINAEHRAILDAVVNRQPDTAQHLLTHHIQQTTDLLLAALAAGLRTSSSP